MAPYYADRGSFAKRPDLTDGGTPPIALVGESPTVVSYTAMDAQQREREQQLAAQAEPLILEGLRNGGELREVAEKVSGELGVDEVKVYRWTMYIDEKRQKRRKRIALIALGLMWLGALGAVLGLAALLFAWTVASTLFWAILIAVGLIVALPALAIALLARRIAYRK